jgi:cytochrome c oxidase assembly factor CtaG/cytochrome c2
MMLLSLVAFAAVYARGAHQMLGRSTRARFAIRKQLSWTIAGFVVLVGALLSPLHHLSESLFSAHMVQHELLMVVAAPLIVIGRPATFLLWGLPKSARSVAGRVFSIEPSPLAAFILHAAALWIWHYPKFFDASVTSDFVHALQHISFFGTALIFWWALFYSRARKGSEGNAIIYLFLTGIHTTLLGALLSFTDSVTYSVYNEAGTHLWGLTVSEDRQLGGIIMWVPGGFAYMVAALALMLKWIRESGARVAKSQALMRTVAVLAVFFLGACNDSRDAAWAAEMTGGSVHRGQERLRSYGCMSCHSIPGVPGATALVGPPLAGIASRSYIAGVLSNTPQHMIEWIRNPPAIDPKTAMPNMKVTESDARDIAAYLYTLR